MRTFGGFDVGGACEDLKEVPNIRGLVNLEQNPSKIAPFDGNEPAKNTSLHSGVLSSTKSTVPKLYACKYCHREFYSSQALGGHQNFHKRERSMEKRVLEISLCAGQLPWMVPFGPNNNHSLTYLGNTAPSLNFRRDGMISDIEPPSTAENVEYYGPRLLHSNFQKCHVRNDNMSQYPSKKHKSSDLDLTLKL